MVAQKIPAEVQLSDDYGRVIGTGEIIFPECNVHRTGFHHFMVDPVEADGTVEFIEGKQ